jgi:hypothetical protein
MKKKVRQYAIVVIDPSVLHFGGSGGDFSIPSYWHAFHIGDLVEIIAYDYLANTHFEKCKLIEGMIPANTKKEQTMPSEYLWFL